MLLAESWKAELIVVNDVHQLQQEPPMPIKESIRQKL